MTWQDKSMMTLMNSWELNMGQLRWDPWDTGLGRDSHFHGLPPRSQETSHIKSQVSSWQRRKLTLLKHAGRSLQQERTGQNLIPWGGTCLAQPLRPSRLGTLVKATAQEPTKTKESFHSSQTHLSTGLTGTQNKTSSSQTRVLKPKLHPGRVRRKLGSREVDQGWVWVLQRLQFSELLIHPKLPQDGPLKISCFFSYYEIHYERL